MWAAIRTRSNRHQSVVNHLCRLQLPYVVFYERRVALARRGTALRPRLIPAFPGYVFTQANDRWSDIRMSAAVLGFIMNDGRPALIDLAGLLQLYPGGIITPLRDEGGGKFKPGDSVRITDNHHWLGGHDAVYRDSIGDGWGRVEINIIGRPTIIPIHESSLDIVESTKAPTRRLRNRGRDARRLPPQATESSKVPVGVKAAA